MRMWCSIFLLLLAACDTSTLPIDTSGGTDTYEGARVHNDAGWRLYIREP